MNTIVASGFRPVLARRRLIDRLSVARAGFVWAPGGYGKSTLAAQLAADLDRPALRVRLTSGDDDPARILAKVRAELRRTHRSDALAAIDAEPADPEQGMRALATVLRESGEPLLIAFDDAHHAGGGLEPILDGLAGELAGGQGVLVLGRDRIPELGHWETEPGSAVLESDDLAFTDPEIAELAALLTGRSPDADEIGTLSAATGGWAAALTLAITGAAGRDEPGRALREQSDRLAVLGHLLGGLLARAPTELAEAVVQLAHLPLLSEEIGVAVGGDPGLVHAAVRAGFPITAGRDGWSEMPGPVAEYLTGIAPLEGGVAVAAARSYSRRRELGIALRVLLAAGQETEAARMVSELSAEQADRLDHVELGALVSALPEIALRAHPRVLVHLARACEPVAALSLRTESLHRAVALAGDRDPALAREIAVERARDLARDGDVERSRALAEAALRNAGEGELVTRARALTVLGQAAAAVRTPAELIVAQQWLEQALVLCRSLGRVGWTAQVVLPLAISVHHARGEFAPALARLDAFLAELPARSRHRAIVQVFRADLLVELGDYAQAVTALDEVRRLARSYGDERAAGYAEWSAARMHSQRGDGPATDAAVRAAEQHPGDWFAHPTGTEFLAESSELLDRAGLRRRAEEQLAKAVARDSRASGVVHARAALAARHGDPAAARETLDAVDRLDREEPRERWRWRLLRAYAAHRAGDPAAAPLSADALRDAARLGRPGLAAVREPAIVAELAPVAARADPPVAGVVLTANEPLTVRTLGGFALSRSGQPVAVAPGRPAALLRLVALSGDAITVEAAAEMLWPEADPATGRRRLRNVVNRLQSPDGPIVTREGERLRLAPGTIVDARQFDRDALAALPGGSRRLDPGLARAALERYTGDLLPGEHDEWIGPIRERLRARHVALLDRLAADAESREDYDEALRLLDRAVQSDPLDDRRYLLIAGLQAEQGRRGVALATLRAGARALAEIGVPEPEAYRRLAARLRS